MENLPDVLLSNIFIRLLAKQLAQMRCVSKSWNALLSESSFIKSHLHRSIQNNTTNGILLLFYRLFSFGSKSFTAYPSQSPHSELTDFIKLPINHQSENNRGKVIGSVNGLICFKYGSNHDFGVIHDSEIIYGSNHDPEVVCIWNPSLSALLTLPPYYTPPYSIQHSFRFGFDPKTDDYKVVKFTRPMERQGIMISVKDWLPIEVYSMRKGSWKSITQRLPSNLRDIFSCDTLCVDGHEGHLHWITETDDTWNSVLTVFTFDLSSETFWEMPFPKYVIDLMGYHNANDVWVQLGVLGGKLCVMSRALPDYKWEVWVMDEYGVGDSWVKHYVFPPFSGYNIVGCGFTLQNEFFIKVRGRGFALYDPVEEKTKIFKSYGENVNCGGKVVNYVDSLVWVTPERSCCSISQFKY
ncbi:F-box protein CPR1 [Lactuca sativa]|uniref:F-box protein CPR1 n=1 Tax=Lactuca sativa TaxID=4236 RepID=UPI000CA7BD3E|nr:F-box protein CPR1 [Lactuca sativa]